MRNEKGVTLVELLITVVIAGIIIVPLFTMFTGSFSRTVKQGEDTQFAYYGQQVMEVIREEGYFGNKVFVCRGDLGCIEGAASISDYDATVEVEAQNYTKSGRYTIDMYYEVTVTVKPYPNNKENDEFMLVTVVKK
jgi:prepilin-type N-terminal cleavage/methylation domain-containing protein